jgi:hypothetical protein
MSFHEFIQTLRIVIYLLFLLLLGDGTAISFALITVANSIWQQYIEGSFNTFHTKSSIFIDSIINAVFYVTLNHHLFYALGHHATFTSIPWTAAFVGLPAMSNKIIPGAFVLTHIFSGTIFCSIESAYQGPNLKVMHLFYGFEGLKVCSFALAC